MTDERHYTDDEFTLILRRAAEAQARGRARLPARHGGLSMSEILEIAEQAGLDPELVAEAARALPAQRHSVGARIFGGPSSIRLEFTVDGAVAMSDHARILSAIRRVENKQGDVERSDESLEWKTVSDPHQVAVNLAPAEGRTRVMILVNRDAAAAMSFGASALAALAAGAVANELVTMGGAVEIGIVAAVGAGGAFAVARLLWQTATAGLRRRLQRLADAVAEAIRAGEPAGERPPADSGSGGP